MRTLRIITFILISTFVNNGVPAFTIPLQQSQSGQKSSDLQIAGKQNNAIEASYQEAVKAQAEGDLTKARMLFENIRTIAQDYKDIKARISKLDSLITIDRKKAQELRHQLRSKNPEFSVALSTNELQGNNASTKQVRSSDSEVPRPQQQLSDSTPELAEDRLKLPILTGTIVPKKQRPLEILTPAGDNSNNTISKIATGEDALNTGENDNLAAVTGEQNSKKKTKNRLDTVHVVQKNDTSADPDWVDTSGTNNDSVITVSQKTGDSELARNTPGPTIKREAIRMNNSTENAGEQSYPDQAITAFDSIDNVGVVALDTIDGPFENGTYRSQNDLTDPEIRNGKGSVSQFDSVYQVAIGFLENKHWNKAIAILEKIYEKEPAYRNTRGLLEIAYANMNANVTWNRKLLSLLNQSTNQYIGLFFSALTVSFFGFFIISPASRARTYLLIGKYSAAMVLYEKALKRNPRKIKLYSQLANIYLKLERVDKEALKVYQLALKLNLCERHNEKINRILAENYLHKGRTDADAIEVMENAVQAMFSKRKHESYAEVAKA